MMNFFKSIRSSVLKKKEEKFGGYLRFRFFFLDLYESGIWSIIFFNGEFDTGFIFNRFKKGQVYYYQLYLCLLQFEINKDYNCFENILIYFFNRIFLSFIFKYFKDKGKKENR